jgi:NADPH:quinone reductase-like Zn-dependent oxidoreductase
MLRTSKIKTVIDAVYPLAQIAEAHTYVETGHKRGSVVITV